MRPAVVVILLAIAALAARADAPAAGPKLPAGFIRTGVAERLTGATALAIARDGRVFVCEQTGTLCLVKADRLVDQPVLVVDVDSSWERGLIGVCLDPDFPATPHLYVNYVAARPYPHHRISRFTLGGDRADPASERVLFEGDDQSKMPGKVKNGHQGGAIHFGPRDGKLYIALGEQTAEKPAQAMDSFLGKILRLNPDGSIPTDNPFYATATGKYRAIWALGCRNPFCFAFQPETGRMFINDVGGAKEEINEGRAGANYGWPVVEHGQPNPSDDSPFTAAIHSYPVASITGGAFCPRDDTAFPARYRGLYFFADYMRGFIQTLDPEHPERGAAEFATGQGKITDIAFAPDGSLYVLDRNAWVIDKAWKAHTGTLYKIRYAP